MPKTVIIGFDAADPRLMERWDAEGLLPNFRRLRESGAGGPVRSTIQPLTPIAWTTMVTGMNAGKHSVYDWHEPVPGTYQKRVVNAYSVKAPTLWGRVNQAGMSAGVFNVPLTYPPRTLNGWLVTDILTPPGARNITHPEGLRAELDEVSGGYRIFFGRTYQEGSEEEFLADLHDTLERRRKALLHLIKTHPTDFVMAVFMESDHVMHYFWKYHDPAFPGHKPGYERYQHAIRDVYVHLDNILGEILDLLPADSTILLVSDHGSGPLLGSVYLNKLFMQRGLLAIRKHPLTTLKTWLARTRIIERLYGLLRSIGIDPRPLFSKQVRQAAVQSGLGTQDIDWARTKAFVSGDFGQVSLNIAGREPQGIVDPRDKESLLDEVITLLDGLTDEQGNRIIENVWRAPSLYQGPYLDSAPDLEFSFKDFTYKAALGMAMGHKDIVERVRYARGEVSGGHSLYGIFYARGPGIKPGATVDGLEMSQVAPLVLYSMGLAIPAQMDGKLPVSFFDPGYLADHPAQSSDDDLQRPSSPGSEGYNAEELEQVESRLRGLGYLE